MTFLEALCPLFYGAVSCPLSLKIAPLSSFRRWFFSLVILPLESHLLTTFHRFLKTSLLGAPAPCCPALLKIYSIAYTFQVIFKKCGGKGSRNECFSSHHPRHSESLRAFSVFSSFLFAPWGEDQSGVWRSVPLSMRTSQQRNLLCIPLSAFPPDTRAKLSPHP